MERGSGATNPPLIRVYSTTVMKEPPGILLHTCCAPCASASVLRLLSEQQHPTLFYSNSNIYPYSEYLRRLEEVYRLARILEVEVIEDSYDHAAWLGAVQGLEAEPEKGSRCRVCFSYSLSRTAEKAFQLGFQQFATTLTISPHKSSRVLFEVGSEYPAFRPWDFKKQDGFKRSIELSEHYDLYRQEYCGCEFSIRGRTDGK